MAAAVLDAPLDVQTDWQPTAKAEALRRRVTLLRSPGYKLLQAIQTTLCYSAVVEYLGPRGSQPVPIGVLVVCPGLSFGKAWFYKPAIPLPPRSKRWRQVNALIENWSEYPPQSLQSLEDASAIGRAIGATRRPLLRFREIEARIASPYRLIEQLYKGIVMAKPVDMLEEAKEAMDEAIEALTCPECGQEHLGKCKPTLHRMIMKAVDHMDEEDLTFWLDRVNAELPATRAQLVIQLVARRCMLLARGQPEKAAELKAFFGTAQDILAI